jgi:UDP-GlcNAc:undecaprenyl-phosphate GlcNAc-1-phosphate transferase
MDLNVIIDYLIISIIASMAINSALRNLAKKRKVLIDIPDRSRKFHKRATPLTGGLSILLASVISGELYLDFNGLKGYVPEFTYHLTIASIILVPLFLIDDIKNLKPSIRITIQILLSLYMILMTDIKLENLGNIFYFGDIYLGVLSIPFTVFCAVGLMNAFNMIDGINGLCSGTAMLALLLIGFKSGLIYDSMLVLIIGSMIGFLLFNLRIFGKKRGVFLGDHGSNLIGFWVAWAAIYSSQSPIYKLEPMTMIWFVSIPLLDCIGLIISRINKGKSWSTPGRDHIHHKLMNKFSPEVSLLIILVITLMCGSFGIFIENNFPIWISTLCFILFAMFYYMYAYNYELRKRLKIKNV